MREKTNGEYPKYIVWENVAGAFSSNSGEDFRAVLEESYRSVKKAGPRCLRLVTENGRTQTCSWETDGALLTELSTLSTGECPREERGSTLSQILEEDVPEKYYLSRRACHGILRRAASRGKELPYVLKEALMMQASA